MIHPKEFYKNYRADDSLSDLNMRVAHLVKQWRPFHVLEFGAGSGKNLKLLSDMSYVTALDVSFVNCCSAYLKNDIRCVILGDENYLRHLCNYDCIFTISVLDHIEIVDGIIGEFQRIANVAIYLAETNDTPGEYYYPHQYENFGFTKMKYKWVSPSDGCTYHIWEWKRDKDAQPIL